MEIIINYNDNTLSIDGKELYHKIKDPVQLSNILEEVFHRLNPTNVTVININEDNKYTVGEW